MANTKERRHLWRRPYLMGAADSNILMQSVVRTERNCDANGRFYLTRDYGVNPINLKMIVQLVTGPNQDVIDIHPSPDPDAVRPDLDIAWQFLVTVPIADPVNAGYFTIQTLIDAIRQGMIDGTYVFYAGVNPGGVYKLYRPFTVVGGETLNVSGYAVYPPLDIREHLGYVYLHNLSDPADLNSDLKTHKTTRIYIIDIEESGSDYNLSREVLFPTGLQDEDYAATAAFPEQRTWITSISQSSELADTPGSPRRTYTPKGSRVIMGNEDISQDGLNRAPLALAWNTDELNRRTIRRTPVPVSMEIPLARRIDATPANRNRVQLTGLSSSYAAALNTSDWVFVDRPTYALEDVFRVTDELGNDVLVDGVPVRVVSVVAGPDEDIAAFLSDPDLSWGDVLTALEALPDVRQKTWIPGDIDSPESYYFGRVNQIKYEKIGPSTPDSARTGYDRMGWPPLADGVRYKTGLHIPDTIIDMIRDEGEEPISTSPFLRNVREYDLVRIQNAALRIPVDHNSDGAPVERPEYGGEFTPEEVADALAAANFDYEVEGLHDDYTIMLRSKRPGIEGELPSLLLNDGFGQSISDESAFGEVIVTAPGNFFYQPWVILWPIPPASYKKLFIRCLAAQYTWDAKEVVPLDTAAAPWRPYYSGYDDALRLPDMQRMPWLVSTALAGIMGTHVGQTDEYGLSPFAYPESLLARTEGDDLPSGARMPGVYNEWDEAGPVYIPGILPTRATTYRYAGDDKLHLEDLHRRLGVQGILAGMGRMFDEPKYEYGETFGDPFLTFLLSGSGGHFGYVSGRPMTLYHTIYNDGNDRLADYLSYPATSRAVAQTNPEGPFDATMDEIGIITAPTALFTPEDVGLIAIFDDVGGMFGFLPMTIVKYIDKNRVMLATPLLPMPVGGEGGGEGVLRLYYSDHYLSANEGALLRLSKLHVSNEQYHPMMLDEVGPPETMLLPLTVRHLLREDYIYNPASFSVSAGALIATINMDPVDAAMLTSALDYNNAPVGGTLAEVSGTRYYDGIYYVASFATDGTTVTLARLGGAVDDHGVSPSGVISFFYLSLAIGSQRPRVSYGTSVPAIASSKAVLGVLADAGRISDLRFGVFATARGGTVEDPVHAVVGLANSWHHELDHDGSSYLGTRGFGGFFEGAHGGAGGVYGRYVGFYNAINDVCDADLSTLLDNYNAGVAGEFVAASSAKYVHTKTHRDDGTVTNATSWPSVTTLGAIINFGRAAAAVWVQDRGVSLAVGDMVVIHDQDLSFDVFQGIYYVAYISGERACLVPYTGVQYGGTPHDLAVRGLGLHDPDGVVPTADLTHVHFTVVPKAYMGSMQKAGGVVGISVSHSYSITGLSSSIPRWPDPAAVFVTARDNNWLGTGVTQRNLGTLLRWDSGISGGPIGATVFPSTASVVMNNRVDTYDFAMGHLSHYFDSFASDQLNRNPRRAWSLYEMNDQSGAVACAGLVSSLPVDHLSLRCAAQDVISGDLLLRSGYLITEPFSNTVQEWTTGMAGASATTRVMQRRGVVGELSPVISRRFSLGRPAINSFEGISDNGDVLDNSLLVIPFFSVPHHSNTKDGFSRPKYNYGTGVDGDDEYFFGDWRIVTAAEQTGDPGIHEGDGFAGFTSITFSLATNDALRFINDGESFSNVLRGELAELRLLTFNRAFACECWQDGHAYTVGEIIYPGEQYPWPYICYDAGVSGGTEPAWGNNETVNDGGAKWRRWDAPNVTNWQAGHSYVVGDLIRRPALILLFPNICYAYICTNGGNAGLVEPDWNTLASSYVDGGVVWTKVLLGARMYPAGEYRHRCIITSSSYPEIGDDVVVDIFPPLPPVAGASTYFTGNTWEPDPAVPTVLLPLIGTAEFFWPELSIRLFRTKRRYCQLIRINDGSGDWYAPYDPNTDDSRKGLPGGWWLDPEYRRVFETWAKLTVNDVGRVIRLYTDTNDPSAYEDALITDVRVYMGQIWAKLERPGGTFNPLYSHWKLMPVAWDDVVAGRVDVENEVSARALFIERSDEGDGALGSMQMWHPASDFQSAYSTHDMHNHDGSDPHIEGVFLNHGTRNQKQSRSFDWDIANDYHEDASVDGPTIWFTHDTGIVVPPLIVRSVLPPRVSSYERYIKRWRESRPHWEWTRQAENNQNLRTTVLTQKHTWILPIQMPQGAILENVRLWLSFGGFVHDDTDANQDRICARVGAFLKVNDAPTTDTCTVDGRTELEDSPGTATSPFPTREAGALFNVRMHRSVTNEECWPVFDELNTEDYYKDQTETVIGTAPAAACHRLGKVAYHNFYPYMSVFPAIDRSEWFVSGPNIAYIYGEGDLYVDIPGCGIVSDNSKHRVELIVGLTANPNNGTMMWAGDSHNIAIPADVVAVLRTMKIYGAEVRWTYPNTQQSPGTKMSISENMDGGPISANDPRGVTMAQPKRIQLRPYPS